MSDDTLSTSWLAKDANGLAVHMKGLSPEFPLLRSNMAIREQWHR